MPNPSGKVDARERAVCARVKQFREAINLSQADFAARLGITVNQLAGVEYARTPLRYQVAWRIRVCFGLSLAWLANGEMLPDSLEYDDLPLPALTNLRESALLTEVSDKFHGAPRTSGGHKHRHEKVTVDADEMKRRMWALISLRGEIEIWIARVPLRKMDEFSDKIIAFAFDYLKGIPEDSSELINARHDAMIWAKMRADVAERFRGSADTVGMSPEESKLYIDKGAAPGIVGDVTTGVPTWEKLKAELIKLTAERGMKAWLADELEVSRQVLNNWLSTEDKGKPDARNTLLLLRWVKGGGGKTKIPRK